MIVQNLVDLIDKNCPPNCLFPVKIVDNLTGVVGEPKKARLVHTSKGMVFEIVVDGDNLEKAS